MKYTFERRYGRLIENNHNLNEMLKLLLDWDIIDGNGGEGTKAGDGGAWHGVCHMVAAGAITSMSKDQFAWFEIGWCSSRAEYAPIMVYRDKDRIRTKDISGQSGELANKVSVLAFVEGNSRGRLSNIKAKDPGNSDVVDRRQDYNHFPLDFGSDGGKVWEYWCATRDIKNRKGIGTQIVRAYLTLLSILGTSFAAIVLRGRPDYGHPAQLRGCIEAGLVTQDDVACSYKPEPISMLSQILFYYSEPAISFISSLKLPIDIKEKKFFMYERSLHLYQQS